MAINDLRTTQDKPTTISKDRLNHLLNYLDTYPHAIITYSASDMVIHVHSDASYLSAPRSRSRAGVFFFCGTKNKLISPLIAPIHCESIILPHVMTSSVEAEIESIYHNTKTLIPLHQTLIALGHPQPPTPLQTDNQVAEQFSQENLHQKKTKTISMKHYWIQDQNGKSIQVHWLPVKLNAGDYFTKHHSPKHHQSMCSALFNSYRPFERVYQTSPTTLSTFSMKSRHMPENLLNSSLYIDTLN